MRLKGKNIIIGVTGSIAAYKAAMLVRLLIKEGADVRVLMTPLAKEFITPLTMATLSKHPILVEFFNPENGDWNSHVDLGLWADLYLIAPASANTMGKMANGVADNLLLTTYLSAKCPVMVAPAMDLDMYQHPANVRNMEILKSYGNIFIEPASGELASGLIGKGRMEEPEVIVERVAEFFQRRSRFDGKKILITAGPTYEKIDPVRFIGNYSSGKMGFSLAQEAASQGAEVILITGPVSEKCNHSNITRINIESAEEMYKACVENFNSCDVAIMSAAVADFTPIQNNPQKLKREKDNLTLELKPTKDIAAELGKLKKEKQILVGFALETDNEIEHANQKIQKKNLDFVVLNSLNDEGAGFKVDTNKISIINNDGLIKTFGLKQKTEVAVDILNEIFLLLKD